MDIEIKDIKTVEDGLHEGVIKNIEYREQPYSYTDIYAETLSKDGTPIMLKCGFPTIVSRVSSLGKLLIKFGAILSIGQKINPETILIGKNCSFQVTTESTPKGDFSNIIRDTLKPSDS